MPVAQRWFVHRTALGRACVFAAVLMTLAVAAVSCGGKDYGAFLEDALISDEQLGEGWSHRNAIKDDEMENASSRPCNRDRRSTQFLRDDGSTFTQTVVVVDEDARACVEFRVARSATGIESTTIEIELGECAGWLIPFAPDPRGDLATWLYVASERSFTRTTFSPALAGDMPFFREVASKSCAALRAAEKVHFPDSS